MFILYISDGFLNLLFIVHWGMLLMWAVIPEGIGVHIFRNNHNRFWSFVVTLIWFLFLILHLVGFYVAIFQSISRFAVLAFLFVLHVVFWILIVKKADPDELT